MSGPKSDTQSDRERERERRESVSDPIEKDMEISETNNQSKPNKTNGSFSTKPVEKT